MVLVGPTGGEADHDPAGADQDLGGDFDQSRPPRFDVTFAERVAVAMTLEEAAAVGAGEGFGGEMSRQVARFGQFVRRELLSHRATQPDQQVQRDRVQGEPKEVGHKTVIAQTVGTQTALEFLVAVLALTALRVLVVDGLRQHLGTGTIGDGHRRFGGPRRLVPCA